MTPALAVSVLALTAGVLSLLLPFALHRAWLLVRSRRSRGEDRRPLAREELPRVTVQLPVYNERHVVGRLVDAACRLDHPAELLEIQVLDDSDDGSHRVAAERCAAWRERGVDVTHHRRGSREGFKAGALAWGAARARGEFFLVLDADFVPDSGLVGALLPPFRDPSVGMVQARWDHLNREESWLTRAQAFLLDGHFLFEQGGRYAGGRFFNFNGTAGMWRRSCLEAAGGWEADTLTEDLDLSYRAQMAGWRFAYLDDVGVPAELPSTPAALEVQQRRWAQGGIQTARKILPRLLRGPWPAGVKAEAVVHLCGHLAHPLTILLALLLFPSALARRTLGLDGYLALDLLVFSAATLPFLAFYGAAGRLRGRPWRGLGRGVVRTLVLGIGLTVPVTRAVLRGLGRSRDPFQRTPKRGAAARSSYAGRTLPVDTVVRLALAAVMTVYLAAAVSLGYWASLPFILLFLAGFGALGVEGARTHRAAEQGGGARATPPRRGAPAPGPRGGGAATPAGATARWPGRRRGPSSRGRRGR
jgi:cellulose synthase/poly-beta-1,6-N-acetylglucosamine synthase-like glycosyltransferase